MGFVKDERAPERYALPVSLDSGRKGKAVELLVAASCVLASDGQLNVSTALVDDEGVDLVFNRRGYAATLAVQVKSRFRGSNYIDTGTFLTDIREATFNPRRSLYLLFVVVDAADAAFGPTWLVPSLEFADRTSPSTRHRRRFQASSSDLSRDKWSEFRLERAVLPNRLLEVLDELAG